MKNNLGLRHDHGFTLIELIVTIAIAAVLMTVAVPSFISFQRNSEMTSATNAMVGAINAARAEAMKNNMNAFVIPAAGGTSWTNGWTVFVDTNRDDAYTAGTDLLVLEQDALSSLISVSGTGMAAESAPYIRFNSSGYPKAKVNTTPDNLTFTLARTDASAAQANEQTRRIKVTRGGRTRTCKPSTDTTCTATAE